ncbi:hypothetical protein E0K89_015625 [Aquicoccus sp. SCR17]|nr:hypothetical protein [Carideicomes alvinocaridis]
MGDAGKPDERSGKASGPAAVDRLRDRIDRGGSGDKVGFSDPAAAPLGTDAEAGGAPPTMEQVRRAEAAEHGHGTPRDAKPEPSDLQTSGRRPGPWLIGLAAAVVVIVVVVALWAA